jgi:hypothetical protein
MSTYSVLDLSYAVSAVALAVDDAYSRYNGTTQPDDPNAGLLRHLANIVADEHRIAHIIGDDQVSDPIKELLKIVFGKSKIFGTIDTSLDGEIGFISYRGAESVLDWVACVAFFGAVPFVGVKPEAQVHAGFLLVYQIVRDSLLSNLNLLAGCKRVIVTGHSLGAAVATLCLLDLEINKQLPGTAALEGVTFASPGVFYGEDSAELFDGLKNLRVYNPKDAITHLPPVGAWHVQGGQAIPPNPHPKGIFGQHSLDATYEPGLEKVLAQYEAAGPDPFPLDPVETTVQLPDIERVVGAVPVPVGA